MAEPFGVLLLMLSVLCAEVVLLTSPDRTGSEGTILIVTIGLGLILTGGLSQWCFRDYRRNKDDRPDDP